MPNREMVTRSKRYSQCGFPLNGWGLNLSKGSTPYTQVPKNEIYVNNIILGNSTYAIDDGFETLDEFFLFIETVFIPENNLQGYFFINQYSELVYSNEENFILGSIGLSAFEDADSEFDLTEFLPSQFD